MKPGIIRRYYLADTDGTLLVNGAICATIGCHEKTISPFHVFLEEYTSLLRYSPHFKWHPEIREVPGRKLVLIHPANSAIKELQDSIAPVSHLSAISREVLSAEAIFKSHILLFPVWRHKATCYSHLKIKAMKKTINNIKTKDLRVRCIC